MGSVIGWEERAGVLADGQRWWALCVAICEGYAAAGMVGVS